MTVCDANGGSRTQWLCETCAIHAGAPIQPGDASPIAIVPRLRLLADLVSETQRFPNTSEFDYSGAFPMLDDAIVAPAVASRYLTDLADYIVVNGRLPTDDELPDPF